MFDNLIITSIIFGAFFRAAAEYKKNGLVWGLIGIVAFYVPSMLITLLPGLAGLIVGPGGALAEWVPMASFAGFGVGVLIVTWTYSKLMDQAINEQARLDGLPIESIPLPRRKLVDHLRENRMLVIIGGTAIGLVSIVLLIGVGYRSHRSEKVVPEQHRELLTRAALAYVNSPGRALAFLAKGLRSSAAGKTGNLNGPITAVYGTWISMSLTSNLWSIPAGNDLPRLNDIRLSHQAEVNSAVFSPDGRRVVTASEDHTAQIWDAVTGRKVGPPLRHDGVVTSAIFSPDGRNVVTASEDRTAQIWDAETGRPVGPPLRHDGAVSSAAFSPDGGRLITASQRVVRIWDSRIGTPVGSVLNHEHGIDVSFATFRPDSRWIATGSSRANPSIFWDTVSGKPVGPVLPRSALVHAAAFSPDGRLVFTASTDNIVRIWDAGSGRLGSRAIHLTSFIQSLIPCPDGGRVAAVTADRVLQIWDAGSLRLIGTAAPQTGKLDSLAFSRDGHRILTGYARAVHVRDVDSGDQIGPDLPQDGIVNSVAFSPDGRRVVASSANTATVRTILAKFDNEEQARQLAEVAEAIGGYRLDNSDVPVQLAMPNRTERLKAMRSSGLFRSLHLIE